MEKIKAIFSWSGGKDSSYALFKVLQDGQYDIVYLLTTINQNYHRVSMHGVREELLILQAQSIGIPLLKVEVSEDTNEHYENQMRNTLTKAKSEGINCVIFGDIFLEDLRRYREENMAKINMKAVFPLWNINTKELIADFFKLKFKTVLCCVNDAYLNDSWVGKELTEMLVKELPKKVDPCGENGEFHTFCYEGPLFKKKISFKNGEKIYKPLALKFSSSDTEEPITQTRGFWFIDLIPT